MRFSEIIWGHFQAREKPRNPMFGLGAGQSWPYWPRGVNRAWPQGSRERQGGSVLAKNRLIGYPRFKTAWQPPFGCFTIARQLPDNGIVKRWLCSKLETMPHWEELLQSVSNFILRLIISKHYRYRSRGLRGVKRSPRDLYIKFVYKYVKKNEIIWVILSQGSAGGQIISTTLLLGTRGSKILTQALDVMKWAFVFNSLLELK